MMALSLFLGGAGASPGHAQRLQEPPVDDGSSAPAAEAALARCGTCIERRVGVAALQVVAINLIAVTLNRFYYGTGVDPATWKLNFERGFAWDSNLFRANYLEHPIAGSSFLNAGRSNGMGYWESIPLVVGGSLMFEYTGESQRPSSNDFITTTMGGITLGEALYRLSSLVLDNRATGSSRVVREIGAAIINPVRGFNRLIYGRMGAVGPNHFERHPPYLAMRLNGGARRLASGSSLDNGSTSAFLEFDVTYGDPMDPRVRKPFQAFRFTGQISNGVDRSIDRLRVEGNLYGVDIRRGPGIRHKMVLSLEYDFNLNSEYRYGQNSLNAGVLSHWPLAGAWSLRTNATVEAIPFGAVSTGQVANRGYDFGVGAGVRLAAQLFHRRRPLVEIGYKAVWLSTVNGVNNEHAVQFWAARAVIPLVRGFGLGADGVLFLRDSQAGALPGVGQRSPQLRLYGSWSLQ